MLLRYDRTGAFLSVVAAGLPLSGPNFLVFGPTFTDVFLVKYAANLSVADSVFNLTNTGASSTVPLPIQNGNICVNAYTFSPDEQLISCCSCLVTPDGLASLSANNDLVANTLTPGRPTSIVVKLLATSGDPSAVGTPCNASTAGSPTNPLSRGLAAWGTTIHALPVTPLTPATTFGGYRNPLRVSQFERR